MTFVANSLFEIIAPSGTTLGFAPTESAADRLIDEWLVREYFKTTPGALITMEHAQTWYDRLRPQYKIVRVG